MPIGQILKLAKAFILRGRPIYAHFGITNRCNLNCRMCHIPRGQNSLELSLSNIEKLARNLDAAGISYISLGGGEPLLRKDLPEVIRIFRKNNIEPRLLTNGIIGDEELIKGLARAGLRDISVSLHSLDERKQDYICGQEGVFKKARENLKLFADNFKGVILINTVVSALNIDEIPDLADFAYNAGYYISFVPIEEDRPGEFGFLLKDHARIDKSYNEVIMMKKNPENRIFNSRAFLEYSREYLKGHRKNWPCGAGRFYFSINPQGEFSICHKFPPERPLLKEGVFKDFLNNAKFKERRAQLIARCPGCMRPCWAEISLLMNNPESFLEMFKLKYLKKR